MTDRIDKIMDTWGFKKVPLNDIEKKGSCVAKFIRLYRGFTFVIEIFDGDKHVKASMYCSAHTEDDKLMASSGVLGEYEKTISGDIELEIAIRNNLMRFINDFLAYDFFHDKISF